MLFSRELKLDQIETSLFLFGPRMTGKTTLLKKLKADAYIDLLDPDLELQYKTNPKDFWNELSALPKGSLIIVDEIQKAPVLLNYVQKAIDSLGHCFILSGSSARKLKRGGANLLGGRALDMKLHPLSSSEMKSHFNIKQALAFGTLPKISGFLIENKTKLVKEHLKSYITTYIREEIQAEALTRNAGAFNRFLSVAAQSNGQVIEFANISRECSVPMSTVKEYFQILEDTLIGFYLWPWNHSERKKARPKFYFFDTGVVRAIQNRLSDPITPTELGFIYETWFINELIKIRNYAGLEHQFSFWRNRDQEIDIMVSSGRGPILAIELKSGKSEIQQSAVRQFKKQFPKVRLVVASLSDSRRKKAGDIDVLPWKQALEYYRTGNM
ncbi:AAA family ATPase [bacterium]|nr:AAA family ATPase [bacterium]